MYQNDMEGLGKFKFKKIFKKVTKALKKHPFAPTPVKFMQVMKKKKKKFPTDRGTVKPLPAPVVTSVQEQSNFLPYPSYQYEEPRFSTMPITSSSEQNQQDYLPDDIFKAAQNYVPEPSASLYPFDYVPSDTDTGTENLPIVTTNEFENMDENEDMYLEGLSEGNSWSDLFTGAASEILASQRAKREAKTAALQQAQINQYKQMPVSSGLSLEKMMIPLAIAAGGIFLLMRKRR